MGKWRLELRISVPKVGLLNLVGLSGREGGFGLGWVGLFWFVLKVVFQFV